VHPPLGFARVFRLVSRVWYATGRRLDRLVYGLCRRPCAGAWGTPCSNSGLPGVLDRPVAPVHTYLSVPIGDHKIN